MALTIKQQCQTIWLRALHEPVRLQFADKKQTTRARFTFYDAIRNSDSPELIRAKELVEVSTDRALNQITLQLRSENPFHASFAGQLAEVIAGQEGPLGEKIKLEGGPSKEEVENSLRKLREKVEEEKAGMVRPETPYFKRED